MSYRSERHRRKVMREMRLAGYDLPGSPYQRKNRKFAYHNKRTGVSTGKVKTSKKTITGKRSTNYVKYNWNPNPQQRGMFAAMMAKKADGTYVPSTKEDGTYTREDKKWNEWIAGGKKGPSPYELKHPQMMQALSIDNQARDELIKKWKSTTFYHSGVKGIMNQYDAYKLATEASFRHRGEPIPPENSEAFKDEMIVIGDMSIYREAIGNKTLLNQIGERVIEKHPELDLQIKVRDAQGKWHQGPIGEVRKRVPTGTADVGILDMSNVTPDNVRKFQRLYDEEEDKFNDDLRKVIKEQLKTRAPLEPTIKHFTAKEVSQLDEYDLREPKPSKPEPKLSYQDQKRKKLEEIQREKNRQIWKQIQDLEHKRNLERDRRTLEKQNAPKKEPSPKPYYPPIDASRKPIEYTQPENVKTEADRRRDIKAQGIEEKKSTPKKPKWVDTRKQKYHRRKKPYHRKHIKKAKKVRKRSTTHQLSSGMKDMTLVAGGAILGAAIVNKKVLSK